MTARTAPESDSPESVEGECVAAEASAPPKRYYAAEEAICSTCGRHVDLCKHGTKTYCEDDWI